MKRFGILLQKNFEIIKQCKPPNLNEDMVTALVTAEIMCILNITYVNQNIIPSEYQTSEEVKL